MFISYLTCFRKCNSGWRATSNELSSPWNNVRTNEAEKMENLGRSSVKNTNIGSNNSSRDIHKIDLLERNAFTVTIRIDDGIDYDGSCIRRICATTVDRFNLRSVRCLWSRVKNYRCSTGTYLIHTLSSLLHKLFIQSLSGRRLCKSFALFFGDREKD